MSKQERRLGRGLESMINLSELAIDDGVVGTPAKNRIDQVDSSAIARKPMKDGVEAVMVRPEALEPNPFQPRGDASFTKVAELADSIKQSGMIQPIVARRVNGGLQIVAGERRWRASKLAQIKQVPVLVRDATDEQMLEMALIENIQREDLNPLDRALAYQRFCHEFKLNAEEVGQRLGEDRTTVTNYLRLLELPREVRELLASGEISMGHARALVSVDRPDQQALLARTVIDKSLSVRALEELLRQRRSDREKAIDPEVPSKDTKKPALVADLEKRFRLSIGTKVNIKPSKRKGRGKIVIQYTSFEEFDRIAEILGVEID